MMVRVSLGARRSRLLTQLLTEGRILAVVAACGGLLVPYACRDLIMPLFPRYPGLIVNLPAEIDWRVITLSAGVCLISTLLFSLAPALQASKIDLAVAMKAIRAAHSVAAGRFGFVPVSCCFRSRFASYYWSAPVYC